MRDEILTMRENDIVLRLGCWDLLAQAAAEDGFNDVGEWMVFQAMNNALVKAMAEQREGFADEIAVAMNERFPVPACVA